MMTREPCSSVRKATPAVDMERLKRTSLMLCFSVRTGIYLGEKLENIPRAIGGDGIWQHVIVNHLIRRQIE